MNMLTNNKIIRFATDMQNELNANQHKGNWEDWKNIEQMIVEFEWHKAKLLIALKENDKDRVREYLADCGNILLFIGNVGKLYDNIL